MATMANSSYEELKDSAEIMSVPLAKTLLVDLFKALNANREALEAAQAKVAALDKGEQMMGKMREVVPLVVQLLGKRLEYHHEMPPARAPRRRAARRAETRAAPRRSSARCTCR